MNLKANLKTNLLNGGIWLSMFMLGMCYLIYYGLKEMFSVRFLLGIVFAYVTYPYISKIFW